jgi:S1-C subfamily serine protease
MKNLLYIIFAFIFSLILFISSLLDVALCNTETEKIIEYVKPSVVLIYVDYNAVVEISPPVANSNYQTLVQQANQLATSGAFGYDEKAIVSGVLDYILKKLSENPNAYLSPSKRKKQVSINFGGMGSGVIINPNGYVLTATHVVSMEEEEIKANIISKFLGNLISQSKEEFMAEFENQGIELSEMQQKLVEKIILGYAINNITNFDYEKRVYVGLGIAEKGRSNVSGFFKPANTIKIGSAEKIKDIISYGRDVAILKIDQLNMPTSIISNDEPTEGAEVITIGYPGKVHLFMGQFFDTFTIIKPTITKGIVSAIRVSNRGVRIIQTDATTSRGNSGGPAYNNNGEIIGTVSWGDVSLVTGEEGKDYNYLVSCKEIQNFIKEAGVENVQSEVDKNYRKAIDEFFSQRYRNASRYFKKVQEIYPDHPYTKEYLIRCQEAIDSGKDRSGISFDSGSMPIILIGVGLLFCGGLFLITVGVIAYFLFLRKPKQKNS